MKTKTPFLGESFNLGAVIILLVFLVVMIFGFLPVAFVMLGFDLFGWDLDKVKVAAEIINQVYVGLGAIFAGIGFLPLAWKLYDEYRRREKINLLKNTYPLANYKKNYDFIHYPDGTVYLRIIAEDKLRHIANPVTANDLGFSGLIWNRAEYTILTKEEFDKYKNDEPINTLV